MMQNAATEAISRSQYLRRMICFNSDKTDQTKKFVQRLRLLSITLLLLVFVIFLWMKLLPLIQAYGNSDKQWKGVSEQLITEHMVARNGKNWNAAFTLFADSERVLVTLNIKLIQQDGLRTSVLDKRKQVWLQGIDKAWNNRFYLRLPDQHLIPIVLSVNFKPVNTHHDVVVRKGNLNPNQHNWYVNTSKNAVSHEIGHMLGAYDEYRKGATSPEPVTIKGVSLMGKLAGDGIPRTRHLHLLRDKLANITGLQSLIIVQKEPGEES